MSRSFRSTIDDIKKQIKANGCSLTKLPSAERAQKLHDWLKEKLPSHLDVWIIDAPNRENEVNVYRTGNPDPKGNNAWINSRSSTATRMPAKLKQWKRDQLRVRKKV
tara:strand:+ start:219 stop:539 length:321 start_codon:yes stop_codon:yes gene_type:complete